MGEEALKLELEAMKRDEWEEVLRPHVQQEYYLLAQVHEWLEHLKLQLSHHHNEFSLLQVPQTLLSTDAHPVEATADCIMHCGWLLPPQQLSTTSIQDTAMLAK